jgi:hypothetical protein
MSHLPLSLVPTFAVPLFLVGHLMGFYALWSADSRVGSRAPQPARSSAQ